MIFCLDAAIHLKGPHKERCQTGMRVGSLAGISLISEWLSTFGAGNPEDLRHTCRPCNPWWPNWSLGTRLTCTTSHLQDSSGFMLKSDHGFPPQQKQHCNQLSFHTCAARAERVPSRRVIVICISLDLRSCMTAVHHVVTLLTRTQEQTMVQWSKGCRPGSVSYSNGTAIHAAARCASVTEQVRAPRLASSDQPCLFDIKADGRCLHCQLPMHHRIWDHDDKTRHQLFLEITRVAFLLHDLSSHCFLCFAPSHVKEYIWQPEPRPSCHGKMF